MGAKSKMVAYHPVHGYPIQPQQDLKTIKRNARERSRVQTVNRSFEVLRQHVPSANMYKKLSKVNIIQHALQYIHQLMYVLDNDQIQQQPMPSPAAVRTNMTTVKQEPSLEHYQIAQSSTENNYNQVQNNANSTNQMYNQAWMNQNSRFSYYQNEQAQYQQWAYQQNSSMYHSPNYQYNLNQSQQSLASPASTQCFSPAINASMTSSAYGSMLAATPSPYLPACDSTSSSNGSTAIPPYSPAASSDSGHDSLVGAFSTTPGVTSSSTQFQFPTKFEEFPVQTEEEIEDEDDVLDAIVSWQSM